MQVLIEDVECRARDGQSEEHADESNAGPLCCRGRKAAAGECPQPQRRKSSKALADHLGDRDGDVREANPGDETVEDAGLHLQGEEAKVVGIERGVETVLNRGKVNGVIFHTGVVSFDEQRSGANR